MDPDTPRHEDDLNAFARRLADWRPSSEGLDPDGLLFAAGLAAGRRSPNRSLWLACSVGLALLLAASLGWGFSHRSQHQSLANLIRHRELAATVPSTAVVHLPATLYCPAPNDYFHLRRAADHDPTDWLASSQSPAGGDATVDSPSNIPRAGQAERFRDQ